MQAGFANFRFYIKPLTAYPGLAFQRSQANRNALNSDGPRMSARFLRRAFVRSSGLSAIALLTLIPARQIPYADVRKAARRDSKFIGALPDRPQLL